MAWYTVGDLQAMLNKYDKNLPIGVRPDGFENAVEIWGAQQDTDEDGVAFVEITTE